MNVLIGVGAQVKLARLMLTTDTRSVRGDLGPFLEAAVAGGVDLVQIREPGLDHETELAALRTAWDVAARHRHLVVVTDSDRLATDFGADVVQLSNPGDSAELADFKARLGRFTRLGAEVATGAELQRLLDEPAIDYLLVDAADDFALAEQAAAAAPVAEVASKPWFAVGEYDAARLEQAIAAGVRRIAVSRTLTEADDPRTAARELSQRLREFWSADPDLTRLTFAALAEQA
ncbi:thiamine phosphate synthase [Microlunatus elymi]|uniref:Thiamine phosphate synthase n=1 Tax=Microlunatus elymi TaxID=2596828 RepID=A0A516Q2G0_9ACTN|nr:thiamine phosphate synthase [Microlunatus elymi]QDP97613.1 thiamine phosphate synthase [Microlunatus elymi]